jgi:hypothetical protein
MIMIVRHLLPTVCLIVLLALYGCEREQRPTKAPPAASSIGDPSYAASGKTPVSNHYEENAYAVSPITATAATPRAAATSARR